MYISLRVLSHAVMFYVFLNIRRTHHAVIDRCQAQHVPLQATRSCRQSTRSLCVKILLKTLLVVVWVQVCYMLWVCMCACVCTSCVYHVCKLHTYTLIPLLCREALCSPLLLAAPERVDWRQCSVSKQEETEIAAKMRTNFQPFDFTDN